jgi:hypothetical protein
MATGDVSSEDILMFIEIGEKSSGWCPWCAVLNALLEEAGVDTDSIYTADGDGIRGPWSSEHNAHDHFDIEARLLAKGFQREI